MKFVKIFFRSVFLVFLICGIAAGLYVYWLIQDLPSLSSLSDYNPSLTSKIYDADDNLIGEFFKENRELVPLDILPPFVIQAFIASEDKEFYQHKGLNWHGIIRSLIANVKAGKIVQGASTITQQIIKTLLLTPEKKWSRKIKEMYLAYLIEQRLSKEDILTLYLNQIYFGHGAYGIRKAAWNYFRKEVKDLTLAETTLLAGLPQNPSRLNPLHSPELAKHRQHYVLDQMVWANMLSRQQANAAAQEPIKLYERLSVSLETAPHFVEYVRRELLKIMPSDSLLADGWSIRTTLVKDLHAQARTHLTNGLKAVDKRIGYRGPLNHVEQDAFETALSDLKTQNFENALNHWVIDAAGKLTPHYDQNDPLEVGRVFKCLVLEIQEDGTQATVSNGNTKGTIALETTVWARKPNREKQSWQEPVKSLSDVMSPGDIVLARLTNQTPPTFELEQDPLIEGALLSIHIPTGKVIAMVGGKDFSTSQFNRTYQAMRQLGSIFKPVIYAKALELGLTPNTIIVDAPIIYDTEDDEDLQPEQPNEQEPEEHFVWKPDNYDENYRGDLTLRQAFILSRNIPTIKLVQSIGIENIVSFAKRVGLETQFPNDLSISLGSVSTSLWDIMQPFAIFASGGKRIPFRAIDSVKHLTTHFSLLQPHPPDVSGVSTEAESNQVVSPQIAYLVSNLLRDVVTSGTAAGINKLGGPFAGKTGTTNDFMDAFFIGFTPDVLTGVWVGHDQPAFIGKGEAGARAAAPIWLAFMKDAIKRFPIREFDIPQGVEFAWVDPYSGEVGTESEGRVRMAFLAGSIPDKPKIIGGFERLKNLPEPHTPTETPLNLTHPPKDKLISTAKEQHSKKPPKPTPTQDTDLIFGQFE